MNRRKTSKIDLRWLGNIKEEDLCRFSQTCWEVNMHFKMKAIITKSQRKEILRYIPVYNPKGTLVYETDFGTIELIVKEGLL